MLLPFSARSIGEEESAEVIDALRSGWITTGPKVERFAEAFASFVGAPAVLALGSCTAALQIAPTVLGNGPGDATTTMTFCSIVYAIEQAAAYPIPVDVEPHMLNMDPRQVERALTPPPGGCRPPVT